MSRRIKENFAGDKQISECQRAESWEQGRALPCDVKMPSLGMLRIVIIIIIIIIILFLPLIRDAWPVFTCYLLSAYFSLAESRMRLQRTKSKQREKV